MAYETQGLPGKSRAACERVRLEPGKDKQPREATNADMCLDTMFDTARALWEESSMQRTAGASLSNCWRLTLKLLAPYSQTAGALLSNCWRLTLKLLAPYSQTAGAPCRRPLQRLSSNPPLSNWPCAALSLTLSALLTRSRAARCSRPLIC